MLGAVRGIHDVIVGFNEINILGLYSGVAFRDGGFPLLAGELLPKDTYFR